MKNEESFGGCFLLSLIFVVGAVMAIIGSRNDKAQKECDRQYTKVFLVSSRDFIDVANDQLKGENANFIGSNNVWLNDTGKDLVEYSVEYSNKNTKSNIPVGWVIKPGKYFYWYGEDSDYYLFTKPPSSTTIRVRSGQKVNSKYLHFLDYVDDVAGTVEIREGRVSKGKTPPNEESHTDVQLSFEETDNGMTLKAETFAVDNGFGYTISVNGKVFIEQDVIPDISETVAFKTKEDAFKVGKLVVKKMLESSSLPSVSVQELISLGVELPDSITK